MTAIAIPAGWTTEQIEAAENAIEALMGTGHEFSRRTLLVVGYEAMASAGRRAEFSLEPLPDTRMRELAMKHDPDWQAFGRAVEEAHGIDDGIPF